MDFAYFLGFETTLFNQASPFSFIAKTECIVLQIESADLKF